MPLRWQEHYQEEISETASVETDDNMGPHPEQAISILWRSETSSYIGGGLVICSICPQTRSVAAARSRGFVIFAYCSAGGGRVMEGVAGGASHTSRVGACGSVAFQGDCTDR